MKKYDCGHESKPIFVNNESLTFAMYKVWQDRNNNKECFKCFCDRDNDNLNPSHYCGSCNKYIGHRGFCSTICHDKYYDDMLKEDK